MSMFWAWDRILGDPPSRTCRVCKHEGLESYCPNCLADTMVAKKRRVKKRTR